MSWVGLGETSGKTDPKYWDPQLTKAKEELWKGNIDTASKLFAKISKELDTVRSKSLQDAILVTKAEAHLGIWAVGYRKNKLDGAGYRAILQGVSNAYQLWLFVAKAFILVSDTSPDALFAYQELLKLKPSEKNALALLGVLQKAEFSPAATNLLKAVIAILPDDLDSSIWYCRWALKAGHPEKAEAISLKILQRNPDHAEANRCLGYLAETRQQWYSARDYYQISQDWLRLAVCYNHLGDNSEALLALMKVEQEKRMNSTWLYHAGWANYKTGSLEKASQYWQELAACSPQKGHQLVSFIGEKLYYQHLTDLSRPDQPIPETMPEEYKNEVLLRRGAILLMLNRDLESAGKNFQQITSNYPKSTLLSTYLLASKNFNSADLSLDKIAFEQLRKENNDASIYLLIRGLWFATSRPDLALLFLEKASQEGISHHLSAHVLSTIRWILTLSAQNNGSMGLIAEVLPFLEAEIERPDKDETPFYFAIYPSLVAQKLKTDPGVVIPWINSSPKVEFISPIPWKMVQAVYYALHSAWIPALNAIQKEPAHDLEENLIHQGVYQSAQNKEWQITGEILSRALNKYPDNPAYLEWGTKLQGILLQRQWREHDYGTVEKQLQTTLISHPGDSQTHHNLAILYTCWAREQDEKNSIESSILYWKRAIGHWAVVLSDNHYWISWMKQHNHVYENENEKSAINNLIDIQLPDLLRTYFSERENQVGPVQADNYHYFSILLEQERDILLVIRRVVKQAKNNSLPEAVSRWLSPVLVKEYAGEEIGKQLIKNLQQYKLSDAETKQIGFAFSYLYEIHLMALSGQYEPALNKLQSWEQKRGGDKSDRAQASEEKAFVMERFIRDLLRRSLCDDALKRALENWQLQLENKAAEKLYLEVSLEWAKKRVQVHDYENAVNQLRRLRKRISEVSLELDDQLAEALTSWGWEALDEKQVGQAQDRFKEALELDSANLNAQSGMVQVYLAYVIDADQKGDKKSAYEYAQEMYKCLQDVGTATIYARACARYALQLSESGMFQNAIGILNPAFQLPYDRSAFQLEKLMSGILTDYGAQLFNSGQRSAGIEMARQAVSLDPENTVAAQNLRIARGW